MDDHHPDRASSLLVAILDGLVIAVAAAVAFDALGAATPAWRIAVAGVLLATVALHRVGWRLDARAMRQRLEAREQARRRLTTHDPVTGLRNRYLVVDDLRRRGAEDPEAGTSVLLVRLDQIGTVQRALGHDQSDALVLRTAQRLRAEVADDDRLGRLDSGEFVVVADADGDLDELARRLQAVIAEPQRLGAVDVVATASIGIARGHGLGDPAELLRQASLALAAARGDGLGRVAVADPRHLEDELSTLRLATELRRAVPDDELEVYYQPIVALPSRRVVGAEALIRWNHPREGVLTPDRWLDVADATGLLPEIGRSTLDDVCRRFATLNARRRERPLRVSVNLATSELRHPELVDAVAATLDASGLAPASLVAEVGSDAVADPAAVASLQGLHELGVRVAVDDVGSGFASFEWTGSVPIDELKLDRAIVERLDHPDGEGDDVAGAVVDLARRLGLDLTAEGVSTEHQAERLGALGCPRAQGWLFGRPLPYSRFSGWIERMEAEQRSGDGLLDDAAATGSACEPRSPLDRLR